MGPLAFRQTKPLRPAISAGTIQLPTTLDARPRRSAILIPDQLPANKGGHGRLRTAGPQPGKGIDSWPPGWRTAHSAADCAAWMASGSDAPAVRCAARAAVKASLAPVVSTAVVF